MNEQQFIRNILTLLDMMAGDLPEDSSEATEFEVEQMIKGYNTLFAAVRSFRTTLESKDKKTRDYHVGESNYSQHAIQPWDVWIEYSLNPWDADMVKRILRAKAVPGLTPKDARIQDYKKVQHISQERIDQIENGEPWYQNFKMPAWVENDE